jgi:hypothetical protein
MITFLPCPFYDGTAKILDYRRLGKQRVEALMILRIFDGDNQSRWKHHPAVSMWEGYGSSLQEYTLSMCREWIGRGYKDTITPEIEAFNFGPVVHPPWLGNRELHISHQSNLVRKLPEHYRSFFPEVEDTLPYFWPTKKKV